MRTIMIFLLALIVPLSLNVSAETKSVLRVVKTTDAQSDKSEEKDKEDEEDKKKEDEETKSEDTKKEDQEDQEDQNKGEEDPGGNELESGSTSGTVSNSESESEDEEEEEDEAEGSEDSGNTDPNPDDGNNGSGSGSGSGSGGVPLNTGYTILAWNNLGMHCMDDDYDIFSILPPYNTVNAHLLHNGDLVEDASNYRLTYEAIQDPSGSINSTSVGKTNFWEKGRLMYGNATLQPDVGLESNRMPGLPNQPQDFKWGGSSVLKWFEATGIPIAPTDDAGNPNSYPLMRVKAWDTGGNLLAQVDVVLPVSDEMDCRKCHASGAGAAARPTAGWENDGNNKHDFRLNILRLHDEKELGNPVFQAALQTAGYSSQGLYMTAKSGTAILCATCHNSEALPGTGVAGVPALTQAMHASHANVISADTGQPLNAASNRSACYQCHPGSSTQCLRGAMGAAIDQNTGQLAMQCQDCHGSMSQVGSTSRVGWLDEPTCQACHTGTATSNNGQIRYTSVFDNNGNMRQAVNQTFATNANTPAAGVSLYRFSKGHGGLQCSACHGSTHAIWPSVHDNDNILSNQIQGHDGVIAECSACHTTVPRTTNGGPHGMHPMDDSWISRHEDVSHSGCKSCHGSNGGGSVLSRAKDDRSFRSGRTTFWKGQTVGCYECHNGAGGEGRAPSAPSVTAQVEMTLSSGVVQGTKAVGVTPSTGTTIRIVKQPRHGTAAVQGQQVVYYRNSGYMGDDSFTYAASNGKRESNLGNVVVHAN